MHTKRFWLGRAVCAGAIVISIAGGAWGAPLFTESFDGTDGIGLMAYNNHYTVDGSPVAGDKAEIDSPGLSIPGKLSAGNSLYITRTANMSNSYHNDLDMPDTPINTTGQAIYFSAFFKPEKLTANSARFYVELPFRKDGSTLVREQQMGIKYNSPLGKLEAFVYFEGSSIAYYTFDDDVLAGETIQMVMRVVMNANTTLTVSALVDPAVGEEPASWANVGTTDSSTGGWHLNFMELGAYRPNTTSVSKGWIDEIRIGTSYADVVVVPDPATLSLLAPGGLAMVRRRRTRLDY